MANAGKRVDIHNLLSLGDDLVGVLKNKKDGDSLMQSLEGGKMLRSLCQSDSQEIRSLLEHHQKKINACQEKIKKARCETIADDELQQLQNELEDKLQEERLLCLELRTISDELGDLEHQMVTIEERKEIIKKKEKDISTARDLLSMCASVTSIIPNLEDEGKISGCILFTRNIVERNKKKVEKFEFEPTASPIEVCNRLWKMA
uniref:Kinetochore protein SPC24 homolog isoform X1 n=1 Tax=Elaeis guineensis var. tenera TaxID=51953 RepID=A0A6I9QYF7_ELAGV|nr:kinetochore protein SPC24 homolog isoform X1 [Elaeis guineensis]